MDLVNILNQTITPEGQAQAAAYLQQASQHDFPNFIKSLSDVLANPSNDVVARSAAGLQLKNLLTAKDSELRDQVQKRWLSLDQEIRNHVKRNVVSTLGTENTRPSAAAQCVAYIAVIELPLGSWPDLIETLCGNVTNPSSTNPMKEATLEAVGYICQDTEPEVLVGQSNLILTAIVHGMRREEANNYIKFAATTALLNSLEFTKANFERDAERNFIMQVVCEATQSDDLRVKVAALQCLVKIMSLYYQYMENYMRVALFAITVSAMKSEHDEVALQGIEFWSNVCDEEVDLAVEAMEAAESGKPPSRVSKHYAKGALDHLVPILTECLCKQDEHDDEDDWNPCKAAGVCLMLLASCVEDQIIPAIMPFVQNNISSPDWKRRDAAIMAFGSMLEGPDPANLRDYVIQALPMLIQMMNDPSIAVRDTTAWTIGRICELNGDAVLTQPLEPLIQVLLVGLGAEARVAANVCWAFNSLAEAAFEAAEREPDTDPPSYALSPYFETIVNRLLFITERPDGAQANLRSSAYEALMEMMKNSPKDCYSMVQETTVIILKRLQVVLQIENNIHSVTDRNAVNEMASLLCATLQSVLRKMTPEDAPQISDEVMRALISMLNTGGKSSGVQEDAIMAVAVLVEVLGDKFLKYMEVFKPFMMAALQNHVEYQVMSAAVGLVADMTRALGKLILPYCDEIMTHLLKNLGDNDVHRSVKPQILAVFGDIALAIGPDFKNYLQIVLQTLMQASLVEMPSDDYDMIDYINELRENCLEAYTGIVQGLKGDSDTPSPDVLLVQPHLPYLVTFINNVAKEQDNPDELIAACAGLIGDLLSSFGQHVLAGFDNLQVSDLLIKGKRSKTAKTRTLCVWAIKELRKLKNQTVPPFQEQQSNLIHSTEQSW